jgi:hypothetical protein
MPSKCARVANSLAMKQAQLFLFAFLCLLPACGAADRSNERGPGTEESEAVGVTGQALHQDECWTATTPHYTLFSHGQQGNHVAVSTHAQYTRPNCPNQWVVEVEQVLGKLVRPMGGAAAVFSGGVPQDWCPGFWANSRAKGWKNGAWHNIVQFTSPGQWTCSSTSCACRDPLTVTLLRTHGYSKVRTVTAAGFAYDAAAAYAGVWLSF